MNNDGVINISDQVYLGNYLFQGAPRPDCDLDPSDFDDSGVVNITDYVRLGNFLWLGGDPPAAPYPDPGCDCTEDSVDDCASPPIGSNPVIQPYSASILPYAGGVGWDYVWHGTSGKRVRLLTRNFQFEDCSHTKTDSVFHIRWSVDDPLGVTPRGSWLCQRPFVKILANYLINVKFPCG